MAVTVGQDGATLSRMRRLPESVMRKKGLAFKASAQRTNGLMRAGSFNRNSEQRPLRGPCARSNLARIAKGGANLRIRNG